MERGSHTCTSFEQRDFEFELSGNIYKGNGYVCTECEEFYTEERFQMMMMAANKDSAGSQISGNSYTTGSTTQEGSEIRVPPGDASNEYLNEISEYLEQHPKPIEEADLVEAQQYLNKTSAVLPFSLTPDVTVKESANQPESDPAFQTERDLAELEHQITISSNQDQNYITNISNESIERNNIHLVDSFVTSDLNTKSSSQSESTGIAKEITLDSQAAIDFCGHDTGGAKNLETSRYLDVSTTLDSGFTTTSDTVITQDQAILHQILTKPAEESRSHKRKLEETDGTAFSNQLVIKGNQGTLAVNPTLGSDTLSEKEQGVMKRMKKEPSNCAICPGFGKTFTANTFVELLNHLKIEHRAKLLVTKPNKDVVNPPTVKQEAEYIVPKTEQNASTSQTFPTADTSHEEQVYSGATKVQFKFVCPKCCEACETVEKLRRHLNGDCSPAENKESAEDTKERCETNVVAEGLPETNVVSEGLPETNVVAEGLPETNVVAESLPETHVVAESLPETNVVSQGLPETNVVPVDLSETNVVPENLPGQSVEPSTSQDDTTNDTVLEVVEESLVTEEQEINDSAHSDVTTSDKIEPPTSDAQPQPSQQQENVVVRNTLVKSIPPPEQTSTLIEKRKNIRPYFSVSSTATVKHDQSKIEANILSISCIRCNRTYSTMKECDVGVLQCNYCRWTFESPCHLRCHIDHFHTDDLKCPYCPFVLKKGGIVMMDKHYKLQHPMSKIFHCYLCEMEFNTKACLRNHILRHFQEKGDYECPHCHMRFELPSRINVHVVRSHSMLLGYPRGPDVKTNDNTTYMCGICGNKYKYAGTLHMHLEKHHLDAASSQNETESNNEHSSIIVNNSEQSYIVNTETPVQEYQAVIEPATMQESSIDALRVLNSATADTLQDLNVPTDAPTNPT